MRQANIVAEDFYKTYGTSDQLVVKLYELGQPLNGYTLKFTIHGVDYTRTTDTTGTARMNINLDPGKYPVTITFQEDGFETITTNINVYVRLDTFMDGTEIIMTTGDGTSYKCAVYDQHERLLDATVTININGVDYTRHTDSDGLASIVIRLSPGTYKVTASFSGDDKHNPSSVTNLILVNQKTDNTKVREEVYSVTNDRVGFMESHIYVGGHPDARNFITLGKDVISQIEKADGDIWFKDYEITETDPRVKTAKFTTDRFFDLSANFTYVIITSPYHENFGGQIISSKYDKSTKLYTYQCQDWRRRYQMKNIIRNETSTIYDRIKDLLCPNDIEPALISGLHPLEDYSVKQSPIMTPTNYMGSSYPFIAEGTHMDMIQNMANYASTCDIWFDIYGVCHIDPINIDQWLRTGLKISHVDLIDYNYGFDITNIITKVIVKDDTGGVHSRYTDTISLASIVGWNSTVIDPVKTQVTTETTDSDGETTTSSSSSTGYGKCGVSSDKKTIMAVGLPSATADNKYGYTWYESVFQNKCPGCGKETLVWGIFWAGNETSNWGRFECTGNSEGGSAEGHIFCTNCDRDYSCISGSEHVNGGKTLTRVSGPTKSSKQRAYDLKNGKLADITESTGNDSEASSTTTTTQMISEELTYDKALDEMSKSVRDLLSFEIELPLNSPVFKKLHTNSLLWTELPNDFQLENIEKIFKLLPTYKVNRGIGYVKNQWYVEKIVTKMSDKGLTAKITLNPFPSSYSAYAKAFRDYMSKYDQVFNQQTTTDSVTGSDTSSTLTAKLGNDCTDNSSIRAMSGAGWGNSGHGRNFDEAAKKGYAVEGANYYNWARQYKDVISLLKALSNICNWKTYSRYSGHSTCPQRAFNTSAIRVNCWDGARLVKVICDSCGFPCVIVTGSIYEGGHGWNAVKYNGTWYTFDLFYTSKGTSTNGTNSLRGVW